MLTSNITVDAKVVAVVSFPIPSNRKQMIQYVGMTLYYRKFCWNFFSVPTPLTDLLKKDKRYVWNEKCEKAFTTIKTLLLTGRLLVTQDYQKYFKLHVDASDYGAGVILLQEVHNRLIIQSVISRRNLTNINTTIPHARKKHWWVLWQAGWWNVSEGQNL